MKKRMLAWMMAVLLGLVAAVPAMAANVFAFAEKNVTLREGESIGTELTRKGSYEKEGTITYSSSKPSIATVSEDGTVTAVSKGKATITATLSRKGKKVGKTQMTVTVIRSVTRVTLNAADLAVYDPDDPTVADLLEEETEYRVLVLAAGAGVTLSAICTPEDASNTKVKFSTSDAGIAKISGEKTIRGVQRGECDLIVASVQDPEVTETYRVLVTKPVTKVRIETQERSVAAGTGLQLEAVCLPEDASVRGIVWSSQNPSVASVDANGYVTGLKKGTATITATAADGSKVSASAAITVTQPVTDLAFAQTDLTMTAGKAISPKVTILPSDASDKTLIWSVSDETVAVVQNGKITGRHAGTCTVTCASRSNPDVTADAELTVIQPVTGIKCVNSADELSLLAGESVELRWQVLPEDATNQELSFKSLHPKVVTVDANGIVRAVGRGTGTIVATALDGSKKQGTVKINVIQPVTGVSIQKDLYYVQRGRGTSIKATVEPHNANNQKVYWASADENIATVRSNGTSTGYVQGVSDGTVTITGTTDDGGYTATTQVRVGDYNAAVLIENLEVNERNEIRILLRNMTTDISFDNVYYRIECFDRSGKPLVCSTDGFSTRFEGDYPAELLPLDRSVYSFFRFKNYAVDQPICAVIMTVTGWRDVDGFTWTISEDEQVHRLWTDLFPHDDDDENETQNEEDYLVTDPNGEG